MGTRHKLLCWGVIMLDSIGTSNAGVARLPWTALPGVLCDIAYQCNFLQHHLVKALHYMGFC